MEKTLAIMAAILLGNAWGCSVPLSNSDRAVGIPPSPTSAVEIEIKAEDNGRQVELSRGQILVVSLESNPGTGYSWQVEEIENRVLKAVGEPEFKSDSKLLGAPAMQVMRFQAIGIGQTTLKLAYRRPWEKSVPPTQTFIVYLVVR